MPAGVSANAIGACAMASFKTSKLRSKIRATMAAQQADGYYPRLNGALLASGNFGGMIVSVVGTVEACDGQYATVKCCDGGQARLQVDPSFAHPPGTVLELIGVVTEGNEVQVCFVCVRAHGFVFVFVLLGHYLWDECTIMYVCH